MDISRYKRFVEHGNVESTQLNALSDKYSEQYNSAISMFDVLINSDRADTIYKDGKSYKAIVDYGSHLKKNELNKDLYRREVRTRHLDNFRSGNIVDIENRNSKERQTYLILKNMETKEGYDLNIVQHCNHTLKWQRNCKIFSQPVVVFSKTAYKDDTYADKTMILANGQFQLYIQRNEDTESLKINDRFFVGREVYKTAYIDDVVIDGVLIFTLNKDEVSDITDNVELGIADYDYHECEDTPISPTPPTNSEYEIIISGDISFYKDQAKTYTATLFENGSEVNEIVNWSVNNNVGEIVSVNGNSCVVKGNRVGTFELSAEWDEYVERITVRVMSLW